MKLPALLVFVMSLLCLPSTSFAWGADGHQSVGAIADALIKDSRAGQKVKAILGSSSLEQISVWADCAKGIAPEKDFSYTVTGRFPECGFVENPAAIAAMSDYVKRNNDNCKPGAGEENCHKQYHYADVALQHDHYQTGYVGTSDHDVVHAINAAILVLQGKPAPAPFSIQDEHEALALLVHFVGDIHQPLHVGSIFLNADGKQVNPDQGNYDQASNTVGGNALQCPCGNLHSLWDDLAPAFKRGRMNDFLIQKAKTVPQSKTPVDQMSVVWANDAIRDAKVLFAGTQFSASTPAQRGNNWSIGLPLAYEKTMANLKEDALARAGAHLAQVLQAIWPE